jgi:SARP family transcriptional regulator, regulator of embCAB operon
MQDAGKRTTRGLQLKVFLAGRVAVERDGVLIDDAHFPGRQGRLLFAYLVAEQGRPVPRDVLAEALWGEAPPATWEKALTVLASKLRGLLADSGADNTGVLTSAFGCYRLDLPTGSWVDVIAAANAVEAAETALGSGDFARAKDEAGAANALLREPFLPGEEGEWVKQKRRELDELRTRALDVLADAHLQSGAPREAVKWAKETVALEPFRETGYRRLMEAHVGAGNPAEALGVYERCRRLFAEELGAYPSPEIESVYRSLLEAPSGHVEAAVPEEKRTETATFAGPRDRAPRKDGRKRATLAAAVLLIAGVVATTLAVITHGGSQPELRPNSVVRIDPDTMKVRQVISVGDAPDLVVAAGGFLWITSHVLRDTTSGAIRNAGDRVLTRVDPSTGKAIVVGGGLAPCGLTADPSGDVWVANCYPTAGSHDNVVRIDARTLDFRTTWPVPGGEGFLRGLVYGGGSLWVSATFGGIVQAPNILTEIDPQTGARQTTQLATPATGLAWSEGYGDLWIDNFDAGSVTRLNATTGVMKTVERVANNPAFAVVDRDFVWVGDWSAPEVVRLHAIGPARPRSISLPARSVGFVGVWNIAAGAGDIWATTPRDGALWRIDPKTNAVTRVNLPYLPTGVTADANDVWVTVRKR